MGGEICVSLTNEGLSAILLMCTLRLNQVLIHHIALLGTGFSTEPDN